jgi:hypothetical protein
MKTSDICLALMMGLTLTLGCNSDNGPPAVPETTSAGNHAKHDHPSTGPHGGDLIELGSEDYHAELTHDSEVIVHLLDGSAKAAAATDATEVTINVRQDGKAEQYRLPASPAAEDPEGKSSQFTSDNAQLLAAFDAHEAEIQLVVMINGKQYRGGLADGHGGEGHDH